MFSFLSVMTLMISPMMVISSSSWITIWIWMELNVMSFIIILVSKETKMKYFLVQFISSAILLASMLLYTNKINKNLSSMMVTSMFLVIMSAAMKMGMAPLHSWLMKLCSSLKWDNMMVILTWQKMIPLFIISVVMNLMSMNILMLLSIVIGTLAQMNISNIKMIMAFSSVSHMGWMIYPTMNSKMMNFMYLMFYSLISIFILSAMSKNKNNLIFTEKVVMKMIFISLLSLAGIPPLLGFVPKWFILSSVTSMKNINLALVMVGMATINFFIYSRIWTSNPMEKAKKIILKKNKESLNNSMNMITPMITLILKK